MEICPHSLFPKSCSFFFQRKIFQLFKLGETFNTNKAASHLQGPPRKMCSVDKSFTIVTLSLELFDEINVDLHLAKFKVTSSSQLWLDACATGSHALHYAPQTCQHNPIKISTSSRIRLRGYWMRKAQIPSVFFLMAHPMHLDNFGQTPILAPEITIECMKWKIQGLLRKPLQTVLVPKLLKTRPIRAMHPFTPFSHQHGFTCCH